MYIDAIAWANIEAIEKTYLIKREQNALKLGDVTGLRHACQTVLMGRIDALNLQNENEGKNVMSERSECAFLYTLLGNGWTVPDMKMFMNFYELMEEITDPQKKKLADDFMNTLMTTKVDKVATRNQLLGKCSGIVEMCDISRAKDRTEPLITDAMDAKLNFTEYVEDKEYQKYLDEEGYFNPTRLIQKGKPIKEYVSLYQNAMIHNRLDEEKKQAIRDRTDYIRKEQSDEELEKFDLTEGHKTHNIYKSTRNAIKEVFGDEIYDDIDEMSKGDEKDRTVMMHHALGNAYLRKGEEVLEIDFAGSGFKETRREYHGQHGKIFRDGTVSSAESILSEFGTQVEKWNGKKFKYLREKTSPDIKVGDKIMNKTRYTIAGPSPDNGGWWNLGEYSIENTRGYGRDFSVDFLKTIFDKWDKQLEKPHDIHINLSGHSRGAVASDECVRLVNIWMKEYEKKNPDKKKYLEHVKIDLMLRDPVPGAITNWRLGKQDLRNVPNLNATVFCSMAQEHADIVFPLQHVRGAKRVIIGVTGHDVDLGRIDGSQRNQKSDEYTHKVGFYDAETGEMFRGSGVSEMPDGVFIADDHMNMIRITSYSQVSKLLDAVYEGKSMQKRRVNAIHDMARNWFVDNDLKMGFADEDSREEAFEKNEENIRKLLNAKSKRLAPIKRALMDLQNAYDTDMPMSSIVEYQQAVIKAGKKYMEKTRIPNSGDSQYRMDLVSDIVSFTMKDKNYITRKHNLDDGRDIEGRALDEKIRKHKQRLEQKPGALERKIKKAEMRLTKDESALDAIKKTRKFCKTVVNRLSKTNVGMEGFAYQNLYDTLVEGSKLGQNTTVNQYKSFLVKLNYATNNYKQNNIELKNSNVGKLRIQQNDKIMEATWDSYEKFNKLTRFIADKDKPIIEVVQDHKTALENIKAKQPNQPEHEVNVASPAQGPKVEDIKQPQGPQSGSGPAPRKI
ncbi:hypothetical protein SAMN02910369_00719 [Lachnospiraceae bacterium NE2001]|nr:hypothetical protein SAMN02910369_00719 [Lachnospiraceae bacterium NE2001]